MWRLHCVVVALLVLMQSVEIAAAREFFVRMARASSSVLHFMPNDIISTSIRNRGMASPS